MVVLFQHQHITSINIVIKAIARSHSRDSVEKAEALLEKLERDYESGRSTLRPDVPTYSSVINCCAYYRYAEGKAYALETALRTFRKVCDSDDEPNNITYGTILKAVSNLMTESREREQLVRQIFDQCRSAGFVDGFVLTQVRGASLALFNELRNKYGDVGKEQRYKYGGAAKDGLNRMLRKMPMHWSENVIL